MPTANSGFRFSNHFPSFIDKRCPPLSCFNSENQIEAGLDADVSENRLPLEGPSKINISPNPVQETPSLSLHFLLGGGGLVEYSVFVQLNLLKYDFDAVIITNHAHKPVVFKVEFPFATVLNKLCSSALAVYVM